MNTYPLLISSPDGTVFSNEVISLSLRGAEGDLAVLAGHAPFITSVKSGDCKIELKDNTQIKGHTEGGLLTVATDKVTLLSASFTWIDK
ncbi:MAG: hypothetical protein IKL80_02875 [Clostridia bacterium]|nr:hypothetical protein [Clostridia bacterium]